MVRPPIRLVPDGKTTAELLQRSGKNIRKYRLRTAICEDRARKEIAVARKGGMNDTEIAAAMGFNTAEMRQLTGAA